MGCDDDKLVQFIISLLVGPAGDRVTANTMTKTLGGVKTSPACR
jgi:hypothetical protein